MVLTGLAVALAGGCGTTHFDAALPATLQDVDAIRDNDALAPSEMREQLAALGIDPVTINGLLAGVRLANQFGGTLTSAYNHVINDEFTELTPDEVQLYGDATDQTTYSDDEAQAIVWFFGDNDIDSAEELQAFVDDPANDVPAEIDAGILVEVFIHTDPNDIRDGLP